MTLDTSNAVHYHLGKFPPPQLDYARLMPVLLEATAALARYDQMLRGMHQTRSLVVHAGLLVDDKLA
jgi:hypothetical protein